MSDDYPDQLILAGHSLQVLSLANAASAKKHTSASEWDEQEWIEEEEIEDEGECDYGVCEFCSDPQTKEMGLCTTECQTYLKAVAEETKHEK